MHAGMEAEIWLLKITAQSVIELSAPGMLSGSKNQKGRILLSCPSIPTAPFREGK